MQALPFLLTLPAVAVVVAAVIVTATLVHRAGFETRRHSMRLLVLLALFVVARVAVALFEATDAPNARGIASDVTETVLYFVIVATGGVVLFDLALPAVNTRPPTLVYELVMAVCYVLTGLGAMKRFGFHPASIVTTSAVVTGILALSLQATLGNVIGGLALQLEQSLRVGDWVQLESGRQGLVRQIRWRHTVFETRDWDTLIVPNAVLLASSFTLLGRRAGEETKRRMSIPFGVDLRHAPDDVIAVVEGALRASPIENVAATPSPACICLDLASEQRASMAVYALRYWLTDLAQDEGTNSRVRTRIYTALKRANIPLASPATHLWIEQDNDERRARKASSELDRRRNALRSLGFLTPLHDTEIDTLAQRLQYCPFVAGEALTREGDRADWLYIVVSGTADVMVASAEGQAAIAAIEGPDVVGEMGLMTGEPRAASIVARSRVESYRLDKEAFHAVLADRPALADEVALLVASRQRVLHSNRSDAVVPAEAEQARLLDAVRRFFGFAKRP